MKVKKTKVKAGPGVGGSPP